MDSLFTCLSRQGPRMAYAGPAHSNKRTTALSRPEAYFWKAKLEILPFWRIGTFVCNCSSKTPLLGSQTFSTFSLSMKLLAPWTLTRRGCWEVSQIPISHAVCTLYRMGHCGQAHWPFKPANKNESDWVLLMWKRLLEANQEGAEGAAGSQPSGEPAEPGMLTARPAHTCMNSTEWLVRCPGV